MITVGYNKSTDLRHDLTRTLNSRYKKLNCSNELLVNNPSKTPSSLLGELLADRGHSIEVVAIGGGSLLLLQLIERPTKDLDLVAIVDDGKYVSAQPLPVFLAAAVSDVALATGLRGDWLNAGPTSLLDFGLPDGFETRMTSKRFGGLVVHLAGRSDQICFKLYASVDQGPVSKHALDLKKLEASPAELLHAAAWCKTHDPSEAFADQLELALQALGGRDER